MPPGRITSGGLGPRHLWKGTMVVLGLAVGSTLLVVCGGNVDPVVLAQRVPAEPSTCSLAPDESGRVNSCEIRGGWRVLEGCAGCSLSLDQGSGRPAAQCIEGTTLGASKVTETEALDAGEPPAWGMELVASDGDAGIGTFGALMGRRLGFSLNRPGAAGLYFPEPRALMSFRGTEGTGPEVWVSGSQETDDSVDWAKVQAVRFRVPSDTGHFVFCVGNLRVLYPPNDGTASE
jgi:hypothetical protein